MMVYPHEMKKPINSEAHFQRLWRTYQCHTLKLKAKAAVEAGKLSSEDMVEAGKFLGSKGSTMAVANYVYTKCGLRKGLEEDEAYLATDRVMTAIGMNDHTYSLNTA